METTAIYARVDVRMLREVAQPWPVAGEKQITLAEHVERYVTFRRALGHISVQQARCLQIYATYAEARGENLMRSSTVLHWASTTPSPRQARPRGPQRTQPCGGGACQSAGPRGLGGVAPSPRIRRRMDASDRRPLKGKKFSTRLRRDDQMDGERGRTRTGQGREIAWHFRCRRDQLTPGAWKPSWPRGPSLKSKAGNTTAIAPLVRSVRIVSANAGGVHIQRLRFDNSSDAYRCVVFTPDALGFRYVA